AGLLPVAATRKTAPGDSASSCHDLVSVPLPPPVAPPPPERGRARALHPSTTPSTAPIVATSLAGDRFPAPEGETGQADDRDEGDDAGGRSQHERTCEVRPGQEGVKGEDAKHDVRQTVQPAPGSRIEMAPEVTGDADEQQQVKAECPQTDWQGGVRHAKRDDQIDGAGPRHAS